MFLGAANAIKSRAPSLHSFMRRVFHWSRLPAVKLLNGKIILAAPALFSVSPTEPHVLRWIEDLLRPGDTFFDVGAHYGWMSLVACHKVGAKGKVVAFEPSPPLVDHLRYHRKANRFHQMQILSKAVADSDGRMVPFHLVGNGDSFLNSLLDHQIDPGANAPRQKRTVQVETVTLDKFCETTHLRPELVKIDVEGAELLVLRGCTGLLEECCSKFIVALHPDWLPEGQTSVELFDLFRNHGYKLAASKKYDGAELGDFVFVPSHS